MFRRLPDFHGGFTEVFIEVFAVLLDSTEGVFGKTVRFVGGNGDFDFHISATVKLKFLNVNLLVGFDVLACADSTAGPGYRNCLNESIVVYAEDGGEFAL